MSRTFVMLAMLGSLAACATGEPVDYAELDALECTQAGFDPETDAYRLCLLLQNYDRRLRAIETRLSFIELDTDRFGFFPHRFGRRHH